MDKPSKKDLSAKYKTRVQTGGVYCVRCAKSEQVWVHKTTDIKGAKNRYDFAAATKTCPEPGMLDAWKKYGTDAFTFEVLEELTKAEAQTDLEFSDDIAVLFDMWQDKLQS